MTDDAPPACVRDVYDAAFGLDRPLEHLWQPTSHAVVRATLDRLRRHRLPGAASHEDLWDLYAVYRLGAFLRLGFQEPAAERFGEVELTEYIAWWRSLDVDVVTASSFHPFFHEIVAVEAADDPDAPAVLVSTSWPCLFWGRLLLSRAGVRVRAGARVLDPTVACRSTLYWDHLRIDRPCQDLSTGWGSNSQWTTAHRRDYVVGGRLLYNVDAARRPAPAHGRPADGLTDEQRQQLLRHRCSVRPPALDDEWPYDLAADEPLPADLVLDGLRPEDA